MAGKKNLENIIEEIKKDFSFLRNRAMGVLIFGSLSEGKTGEKSDIDICIVSPKQDPEKIIKEVLRRVDVRGKNYDVHVFEELPLYMKIEIIENHTVVFGDIYEINEYFYFFRKLWNDQKHRQKLSREEMLKILT